MFKKGPQGANVAKDHQKSMYNLELENLHSRFAYFYKETIKALGDSNVAVPLDMLEHHSYRVYNFVENRCPQILFEVCHANPDCWQVIRCALSLIIVTIGILKKKIIALRENKVTVITLANDDMVNKKVNMDAFSDLEHDMSAWADFSLKGICEGSYLSILVNILAETHEDVTIELVLNLIEAMVTVYDSSMSLLKAPYNPKEESRKRAEAEQAEKDIKAGRRTKYIPKASPSSICIIINTVLAHRNREAMAGSVANIISAILMNTPAEHADTVAEAISRNKTALELPLGRNVKANHQTPSTSFSSTRDTPGSTRWSNRPSTSQHPRTQVNPNPLDDVLKGFSKVRTLTLTLTLTRSRTRTRTRIRIRTQIQFLTLTLSLTRTRTLTLT